MTLRSKSIHELRGIAQSLGLVDIFSMDGNQLVQAIEGRQHELYTPKPVEVPRNPYDARLMTKNPSKVSKRSDLEELLADHVKRGLKLRFDGDDWFMSFDKKNDTGTIRQPLRNILRCADRILQ